MPSANNHDPEKGKAIDGQLPNSEFNFGDSSGPFFTIYSKTVEEEDNKTVERWQKEAEGMIIFNGLFSAVVAALVVVSLQDLRPNSQDRAAFYLEKMYELQLDTNGSRPSTPSVSQPPDFSPPSYAVWVNSLWFSSLVISLTCAMLATSLQQWARRYIRLTQPARFPPHKRARVRAYFANGVDKFRVPWVADALPALVHLSLFIFFVGLVIYLASINRSVFIAVFCCVAALLGVYGCITLTPFFWHDSPYCSPLSSPARLLCTEIVYAVLLVLYVFTIPFGRGTRERFAAFVDPFFEQLIESVEDAAKKAASGRFPEIDVRVLESTIDALSEDDALEQLFESIPGFFQSPIVKNIRHGLPSVVKWKTLLSLDRFLRRTLSSNVVSKSVKFRRLIICLNAAGEIDSSDGVWLLLKSLISYWDWPGMPLSVEIGHFLSSWDESSNRRFTSYVQAIIARIIATVQERDDRWIALASDQMGIPQSVLQDYLAHGNSVLLANLIHIIRHISHSGWEPSVALEPLATFDVLDTLPELQYDFCVLWNDIVVEAPNWPSVYSGPVNVLRDIRHLYIALHQGTIAAPTAFSGSTDKFSDILRQPSSYALCNIPSHRPHWTPHLHETPVRVTADQLSATSIAIHYDKSVLPITPRYSLPDSHPDHTIAHPADQSSLRDLPASNIQSSQPSPLSSPSNFMESVIAHFDASNS